MSEGPPKPQAFSLLNVWGAFLDKCDTGTLASRNSCLGVLLKLRGLAGQRPNSTGAVDTLNEESKSITQRGGLWLPLVREW